MFGQRSIDIAHLTKHISPLDHSQRGQADLNFYQIAFRSNDIFNIFIRLRSFGKVKHFLALSVTGHRMPTVADDAFHRFVALGGSQGIAGGGTAHPATSSMRTAHEA